MSIDTTAPLPFHGSWSDTTPLPQAGDPVPARSPSTATAHALRFTGDGGVYFGVWLVNILLTLVTLGLYTPFARRRTLRYFYAHTLVAGSPLEFSGAVRRMFFGFLLFFGWYLSYEIAGHTQQVVATALLGLLWFILLPWLWANAVRFRVTSTRWRGLQGSFRIGALDAYRAFAPMLVLALASAPIWLADEDRAPGWFGWYVFVFLAGAVVVAVWLDHQVTCARLRHTGFAGQWNRWTPPLRDFFRFSAAAFGIFLVSLLVAWVLVVLVVLLASHLPIVESLRDLVRRLGGTRRETRQALSFVAILLVSFFSTYLALGPALAYRQARKFALLWNGTHLGTFAHFSCSLRARDLVALRVKNVVLNVVTGGFWRPFAVTSEYRLKLESVTLHVHGELDELVGRFEQQKGALGDAVADVVGFDVVG